MDGLAPEVQALAFLLGTWEGEGRGEYPTIEPFAYAETVTFAHVGKPFLAYAQRTTGIPGGRPLHAETGYLRPGVGADEVELVLAHPSGIVEIEEGTRSGTTLHLGSVTVVGTRTAKEVSSLERHIEVAGDELTYRLAMGAVGRPHQHHLAATLRHRG